MAILAIFSGPDINKDHYETLRKELDWEHRQPEGMIFHAAGFDKSGGVHVTDVWTSQEALDQFFNTRLIPVMKRLMIAPPKGEVYELHTAYANASVAQFQQPKSVA